VPHALTFTIDPPVDPWTRPWRIQIAEEKTASHYEPLADSLVPINGAWRSQPLHAGVYDILIGAQDNSVWHSEHLEVNEVTPDVFIQLQLARLRGSVHLGDKPLASTIWIGGERGRPRIEMHSDDSGRFSGYVPRTERNTWPVTVESETPAAKRTFQNVQLRRRDDGDLETDLRLDMTMVQGDVVDGKGAPVAGARVNITASEGELDFIQPNTTADGRFAIYGLRPGHYKIAAMHYMAESRPVDLDIRKDEEAPLLRLVLLPDRQLKGRIQSDVGPVVGAKVTAWPTDVPSDVVLSFNTNDAGAFSATVPAGAEQLDVMVEPPGFALRVFHVQWESRDLMVIAKQNGGTLVIEGVAPREAVLRHAGATLPLLALTYWQGSATAGERTTIGMIEPGNYTVCRAVSRSTCASGYLPPFGTLKLDLAARSAER
jgi:hypothetical protein